MTKLIVAFSHCAKAPKNGYSLELGCGGMDWFYLAQDRGKWRAVVTTVMNPRVAQNAGNLFTS
jgi:hypothetical protein